MSPASRTRRSMPRPVLRRPCTVPGGAHPAPAVGAPTEPLAAADVTAADVMGTDAVTGDVLAAHPPVADQQPPAGETSTEPAERVALAAAPAIDAADEPAAAAPVFDTSDTTFGELAMADPTMDATTDTPVTTEPEPIDDLDGAVVDVA